MKYNYNKKLLKQFGVGPFLGQVKLREKMIAQAPDTPPVSVFNANILAKKLHPHAQYALISKVEDHGDAKSFTLVPDREKGTEQLAYFRAGQYVSVALDIGQARLNKPYSLRSGPKDALNGSYTITVKRTAKGFALAGGSGITPFYSMASAIADGTEDFNLTILYGSRTADSILLKAELEEVASRSGGKVKVVHVLSHEQAEGYEHGFLTAELIGKYAPQGDYSVFLCGPKAMYAFADGELAKLNLKRRRIRKELAGEYGDPTADAAYPAQAAGKTYNITVLIRGESQTVPCRADQTLLDALERAGIRAPSHCRSGECGWCHSRLVSGDVYIPEDTDGRRAADKNFGWIHPCCSYPISDVTLDVPVIG